MHGRTRSPPAGHRARLLLALCGGVLARTLTVATAAQPDTLDPHRTSATSSFQATKSLYDTLVEPDREGIIVGALAQSWTSQRGRAHAHASRSATACASTTAAC
jgi:ABC-type transport system substrate-binding protein